MITIFKNPRFRYKWLLIIIIPLLIIFFILCFLAYKSVLNIAGTDSAASKGKEYYIESMDYRLRNNATDYQITLFKELEDSISENDDIKIAENVVKNYVADVYTWTNKEGKWDVGGMMYVYSKQDLAIYYQIRDGLYQSFKKFEDEFEKENLIEVIDAQVTSSKKTDEEYVVDGSSFDAYEITCEWEYAGTKKFTRKIAHRAYFTVIKNINNNGRFEIVSVYGDY